MKPSTPDLPTLSSQTLSLPGGALTAGSSSLSEKQERIALRRAQVCEEVQALIARERLSLSRGLTEYLALYNTGAHHSVIHATLGEISASTLRRWYNAWKDERDWRALVPGWRSGNVGHEVPLDDFNWLIGVLHGPNKPPLSSALRFWHTKLRLEQREQLVSDRTMERAIKVFAERHAARWSYMRRGAKYFRENYLPYILQDPSGIGVGDLFLSDGNVMNILTTNPYTGKAVRPHLIPIMDYASRMIVGFDIDFSENRRVIASAYRNAITLWRIVPLYFKVDNGRSFQAQDLVGKKMSRQEREEAKQLDADEMADITGSIYATGVQEVLSSLPYNPTGKAVMERWFGTMDNGLERFLPMYLGNSISDKPANLSRNEKHLQEIASRIHGDEPLTLQQLKVLVEWYILHLYGQEPHSGIGGRKPLEVWQEGLKNFPRERFRNADELWYLMLAQEVKKLDRNGVRIRGIWYYDESLMDYVGRKVYVRYDQMDDRYVFVYDEAKNPICRALARYEHDPLVTVRGDEEGNLRYVNDMKMRRRQEKRVKTEADALQDMMKNDGLFLQEAVEKLQRQKSSGQLTNLGYEIPQIPDLSEEDSSPLPPEPEFNDEVISQEFLDAIGVGS